MENIKSFTDLACWKKAREVRHYVKRIYGGFPQEEKYLLVDQMKRATRSVTNNIAEGYGRFHYQENIQFCRQARGSLYEVLDHLIIAFEERYIEESELLEGKELIENTKRILNGYISYLKKAKNIPLKPLTPNP